MIGDVPTSVKDGSEGWEAADKAQVVRAAGLVMALFVISRALGLFREVVISHQFGTSGELDAYLAAFRLPDILFQLVAGGALASAFIPTFAGYLAQEDKKGAWHLASAIINLVLILTAALAVLAVWLAPWLMRTVIAPGFDLERQVLAVRLMRIMLLTPVIFGVSGVIMGILNAHQHFLLPALAPIVYNLGIIFGAVVLAPMLDGANAGRHPTEGLALGVVVGALGHLLIQVPGLVRFGLRYTLTWGLRDRGVHEVGRLMLPRVVGLAAVQLNFLVNTILASGLVVGSLSAINFAWLLMLLPHGIFAQAVATAAFPTFAAQAAKGRSEAMANTLSATLRAVVYLALPAAVGLIVLRVPLVQLLFQRGAFTDVSTGMVAWGLSFFALGLPAHSVVEVIVRAFYAMHDTKTPVVVGIGAMGLNVALSLSLIAIFELLGWLPLGGLALSNSLATTVEMVVLLGIIRRRLGGLGGRRFVGSVAQSGLSALVMGGVVTGLLWFLAGSSVWLLAGLGIMAGVGTYATLSLILRAPEPYALWGMVRSRKGGL